MQPPAANPALVRQPERILIVRLSAMGDIIHTLPAAAALRQAFPDATIGWAVEERWAELLCTIRCPRSGPRTPQRPLVDRIHLANSARWRSAPFSNHTWEQIAAGLSDLRSIRYQVAVDLQGAIRSAILARWSGAPTIYGFSQPRENVASMFYTRPVSARGTHIIEQNLHLASVVTGQPLPMPRVQYPFDNNVETECARRLSERNIDRFVILNPGAGWGAKQWPPDRFGSVAAQLAQHGFKSLINFGPGEEELVKAVESSSAGAAQVLSCSITELIAVTRRASLFIGGDTGPLHLAASLGVPVVGIYGPTNPARNGPYGTRSIVLRSANSVTSHSRRAQPEEGLLTITAHDVVAAALELLDMRHA
ncbi:MAG TPA: glycosyltransferase family 9 protein [Terriglobales bacterium]|nr:glycosyltransferase family 9 protein [Terriglobales bacterium]